MYEGQLNSKNAINECSIVISRKKGKLYCNVLKCLFIIVRTYFLYSLKKGGNDQLNC